MSGALQAVFQNQRSFGAPPGQQLYNSYGTYSWVAPAGVTKVSVVAVGGPGSSNGGGLGYKNNITVNPGCSYTANLQSCNTSYFITAATVSGQGGSSGQGYVGDGGGSGGNTKGGAGGYSGNGGNGGANGQSGAIANPNTNSPGSTGGAGSGGGGGGGGGFGSMYVVYCCVPQFINGASASYGGGVGVLGAGANGSGGAGGNYNSAAGNGNPGSSGATPGYGGAGGAAAVRIIWPGCARSFPSTRTADE